MPSERYYLPESFKQEDSLTIKGSEFHHLVHVMRSRKGDQVEVVNGRGTLGQAVVKELAKDHGLLYITETIQEPLHPPSLILAQAMPKPNRLDFILEKGTELGVDVFWLFPGELSVKKEIFPNQLERAQALTIAAMKQCGRLTLPEIVIQPPLKKWPEITSTAFFGDIEADAPTFECVWKQKMTPEMPIIFITGPESGFTQQEVNLLKSRGISGVKLHSNILRTDTASVMALSLLSHWMIIRPLV